MKKFRREHLNRINPGYMVPERGEGGLGAPISAIHPSGNGLDS